MHSLDQPNHRNKTHSFYFFSKKNNIIYLLYTNPVFKKKNMKFGKEFMSQMVPEWQETYMNYDFLKTVLKDIQNFRDKAPAGVQSFPENILKRKLTLRRAFSGLTQRNHITSPHLDIESQPILVHSIQKDNNEALETMFLKASDEGGEFELVFFRRLDQEFNKVVKFYKTKVEEVVAEANELNKQMDALIAFRIKVDNPEAAYINRAVEMTRLAFDIAASTPRGTRSTRGQEYDMDIIDEEGSVNTVKSDSSSDDRDVKPLNEGKMTKSSRSSKIKKPAPLDILDRMTMNNTVETPRSTVKEFLKILPNQKELEFNAVNLKKVEEQLKKAFIVFHQKLRLLKSFSFLNMMAFSKILKKYDKVSGRTASKPYMKMVDNSYLGSSDKVTKLIERVEAAFIKHFANGNRSKGMNILRPKPRREKHRITFSLGFFVGGTVALLLALVLILRTRNNLENENGHNNDDHYMTSMFPLYSLFGFVVLHIIMYAANIYFWRRYRVNYSFIFGFKEGSALGYRQVLLAGFSLSLLALACVLSNLDMQIDPRTGNYKAITELLPLGLVVLVFVVLFCPLNILYRSSRYFLLTCFLHCIAAPLYKVVLPDFFLADQLTSQVQAIRSLQFYICYYVSGDYRVRVTDCRDLPVYKTFIFIVAGIPYSMRLLQCLRRWYEEKDIMQGLNGVKYFLTILAVLTRIAFSLNDNWRLVAWISSIAAMLVGIYWDLVYDWGLLDRNSKNWMLRDKLLVQHKSVYFVAMVLNTVLRLAWLQTVSKFQIGFMHRELMVTLVACLEILRRGLWNFFRLENEHLNNVGKYRAFKSVPLPFNYDEDEDKDD